MPIKSKENKDIVKVISEELCQRVNLPYPPPIGTKYKVDDAVWTQSEENYYRNWLVEYLKSVPRFKLMGIKYINKEVDWFVGNYGWKYKADGEEKE